MESKLTILALSEEQYKLIEMCGLNQLSFLDSFVNEIIVKNKDRIAKEIQRQMKGEIISEQEGNEALGLLKEAQL